ncbi:MAG: TetR/AcrR family transcriptional regulator [Melioribacteraceae bacterium]|nr:TetR/AcrR family transcriptional regulator [Melioribacteraceae bacterium]
MSKGRINNRKVLIEKGTDLLSVKGYNGTGIKELTDAVGIPKGSFYNYFKSKEEFTITVLKLYVKNKIEFAESILNEKTKTAIVRIVDYYRRRTDEIVASNYTQFCLLSTIGDEVSLINRTIRATVEKLIIEFNKPLINCLSEAQELGEINLALNVADLAEFIENSWRGTLITVKSVKSEAPLIRFREFLMKNILY